MCVSHPWCLFRDVRSFTIVRSADRNFSRFLVLFRSSANFNASEKRRPNGNTVRVQLSIDSRTERKKDRGEGGRREEIKSKLWHNRPVRPSKILVAILATLNSICTRPGLFKPVEELAEECNETLVCTKLFKHASRRCVNFFFSPLFTSFTLIVVPHSPAGGTHDGGKLI